jgi:hypothetical protein
VERGTWNVPAATGVTEFNLEKTFWKVCQKAERKKGKKRKQETKNKRARNKNKKEKESLI